VGLFLALVVSSGIILRETGLSDWNWTRAEVLVVILGPIGLLLLIGFAFLLATVILMIPQPPNLVDIFSTPYTTMAPFLMLLAWMLLGLGPVRDIDEGEKAVDGIAIQ
jgi:hypothetical protein